MCVLACIGISHWSKALFNNNLNLIHLVRPKPKLISDVFNSLIQLYSQNGISREAVKRKFNWSLLQREILDLMFIDIIVPISDNY